MITSEVKREGDTADARITNRTKKTKNSVLDQVTSEARLWNVYFFNGVVLFNFITHDTFIGMTHSMFSPKIWISILYEKWMFVELHTGTINGQIEAY